MKTNFISISEYQFCCFDYFFYFKLFLNENLIKKEKENYLNKIVFRE